MGHRVSRLSVRVRRFQIGGQSMAPLAWHAGGVLMPLILAAVLLSGLLDVQRCAVVCRIDNAVFHRGVGSRSFLISAIPGIDR